MVSGFTDDRPVRDSKRQFAENWALSAERALTVRRALIDDGIPSSSVFAAAFGPEQPVASNADAAGRSRNRRGEMAPLPRMSSTMPKPVIESVRSGRKDSPGAAPLDLGTAITALVERGAQRVDPVRLQFIKALARRAAQHSGAARNLMDGKLAWALKDCGDRLAQAQRLANRADDPLASRCPDAAGSAGQAPRSPLADLLRHIAQQALAEDGSTLAPAGMRRADPPAELRTLRVFKSTWSTLSVDQQLTGSLAKVPENAGPLNSNLLVLRSLKLMRETSPAYLNRFMSYVDALLWLDQASVGAVQVKTAAAQRRRPGRAKPG